MIKEVALLQGVGQFESVASVPFARLTLIYAENGRGKSTLTTVLRSLTGGDRTIIDKRRRFNSATVPKVIVNFEQETPAGTGQRRAIFDYHAKSADAWSALIQGIIYLTTSL